MGRQDEAQVEISARRGTRRVVRVSHASRVIFPATELTPAVTKLELVQYIVTMREPLMRVLHDRPTTLERWPNGVQPGMRLGRGRDDGGFYQKHMMRGAPDYVESVEIEFLRDGPLGRYARLSPRFSRGAPRWAPSPSIPGRCVGRLILIPSVDQTNCG